MLMIVGFVLAFIAFFVATMMTFQGDLPVPVAVIISALNISFNGCFLLLVYKWNSRYAIPMA